MINYTSEQTTQSPQKSSMSYSLIVKTVLIAAILGGVIGFFSGSISDFPSLRTWFQNKINNQTVQSANSDSKPKEYRSVVEEESAVIDSVKKVSPSVVSVVITKEVQNYFNLSGPFQSPFDFFFGAPNVESGEPEKKQIGGGTGFLISSDGLILTNRHVVSDEEAEYSVILEGGKTYAAVVLSRDTFNDLAVIKIEEKNLPVVALGDSEALKLGQTVVAIGNTLGRYQNTVTRGVVSGVGRDISAGDAQGISVLDGLLQTDAAINRGNSGGPLINLNGEVVGVNVAIDREGESIGFAIPINEAKTAIESVKKTGRIIRPILGIRYVPITKEIAELNKLKVDYGVLVVRGSRPNEFAVLPGSAADKAGIVENDIILDFNGKKIDEQNPLSKMIQKLKPGETVKLKTLHDGEEKNVEAILQESKDK